MDVQELEAGPSRRRVPRLDGADPGQGLGQYDTTAPQHPTQPQAQTQPPTPTRALAQAQALVQAGASLPPGQGPGDAAAEGLLQTLSELENDSRLNPAARNLATNLGAAVLHYARTGSVNATPTETVTLPGGRVVDLGEWLNSIRTRRTQPGWARRILEALGMTDLPADLSQETALALAKAQALAQEMWGG